MWHQYILPERIETRVPTLLAIRRLARGRRGRRRETPGERQEQRVLRLCTLVLLLHPLAKNTDEVAQRLNHSIFPPAGTLA